ncbi:killer cell lectin-like receptor subfamily B member 1B allele A isoform X4 [Denticeps clupeoides]|uniref:killer cell lectin-like receptor subfamily B member 1B allele A isoform X4 n=1 Tax=Denticeps clupeoides TaxID=299321 RepID=UPI0010A3217B|nr:killer cell lectin-like receptor subfamily B member 1B allele A isoform X4 [Denticeps clupeoides]
MQDQAFLTVQKSLLLQKKMDDESYANIVFANSPEKNPKVQEQREDTVYAEVKTADISSQPISTEVTLGLCSVLLLLASVTLSIYLSTYISKYKTMLVRYENEITAREQLGAHYKRLQEQVHQLNQTLEFILKFDQFPVQQYCQDVNSSTKERICNPCQNGWKNYMSSCYKFQMTDFPWTTWNKGKTNCSQLGAHLVIIDTKEEQEYINNHTRYYYDDFHGYWFGLSKSHAGKWHWVNGSELNGGNWKDNRDDGNCAMTMPSSDPSRSWAAKNCAMENRWICETEALHWPQG